MKPKEKPKRMKMEDGEFFLITRRDKEQRIRPVDACRSLQPTKELVKYFMLEVRNI